MNNTSSQFTPQSPPATTATPASPTSSRTRSHFYHSEPLPKSPSQGQFPTDHRHTNSRDSHAVGQPLPPAPQTQLPTQLPKATRSSIGGISSPGNHLNRHVISNNNNTSNSNSSSTSASDVDSSAKSNTSADRSSIQFNTSEIEKSYQALIKRQPVGNTGPTVLQGKQRQPSKDIKQRNLLPPNPMSNIHIMQSPSRTPSKTSGSSNPSGSLSHSPIFGSPASEHAKRWVKTVGRDQPSDTESEHPESDQEALEDNQQQQWQIDYENDVAGQVELETETDLPRKQSLASSSWTNKTHALFNMADSSAPKKQGTYPGGLTSTHPYPVHPLSPSPLFLGPGTSGVPPSKSSETPPQKTSQFDISSIPPIPPSAVHQPLPPLPPPPTTAPDKPPSRLKQAKHHDSRRAPKGDRPPAPAPPVVERKPLSLTNPPRKCIHHGKILQIINSTTVKDRYLFLFNDILLIVKHMSEGSPTLESRFQVKDVIELKTITISLTRDKYDPKNGLTGTHSNRKISPILAEFIHTFDQEPEEAIRKFVQKRALHPDSTSVAHLLFKTPELSKSQLALFFSRQANKYVYRSFLDQCQFAGVLLDEALRILLTRLCLPDRIGAHRIGGPSERCLNRVDYLLEEFTRRWYEANANVIVFDASIAHKLVIAMIVLNAQLHHNEGASIVKDREEVGILIRPRIGSQPSTPTIASVPVMDSNLAVPLTTTAQLYMTLELDDLSAFPRPTKESFVESFQHLDQQRIVPRDILHNIYLSISHQPLDIDSDRMSVSTPNPTSSTSRKLPPIMIFPATLPPRLTLKIASDPITITIPTPNPHFSIHLSGKDLKCEPPVLEFGSHRSQLFRITGLAPGRRTLTIQPRIATDKGTVEQYYDMKNLPYKQTIAIERQFMRHTFQISMLNDLGRRRYLFGASTAAEKDEWARVLSHYLHMAKGQNAARLNEHTGLEKSIGLQILKELLLGVDASDQDENEDAVEPSETKVPPEPTPVPTPVVPPPTMGLGIPFEGHLSGNGVPARSAANAGSSTATTAGHHSPKLGSGANIEWPSAHGSNGTTSSKDSWMCRMPKPGAKVPDRKGSELIQLVEQNSLMELVLGFMRDISRDRVRRMEEKEQRMAAKAQVETDEGYEEDEGYDVDDMDEGVEDDEEEEDELAPLASSNVLGSFAAGVALPVEINVEQAPETKKRFSGWPRSAAMLAAKKNVGRSPTIPEDQAEKPKEQQETKVQEQQKSTTSTITEQVEEEEEQDEVGAVSAVSGKAHMVKGKETWFAH